MSPQRGGPSREFRRTGIPALNGCVEPVPHVRADQHLRPELSARGLDARGEVYDVAAEVGDTRLTEADPIDSGLCGDKPSHPELRDFLSRELVTHGWSSKHVHQIVVKSAANGQRSDGLLGLFTSFEDDEGSHQGTKAPRMNPVITKLTESKPLRALVASCEISIFPAAQLLTSPVALHSIRTLPRGTGLGMLHIGFCQALEDRGMMTSDDRN